MNQPDTDVDYTIVYQRPGDPSWYTFTNTSGLFQHAREHGPWNSTTDLAEAVAAAQGLLDRTVFVDSRPKYQHAISAVRIYQTISVGGTLLTLGAPQEED